MPNPIYKPSELGDVDECPAGALPTGGVPKFVPGKVDSSNMVPPMLTARFQMLLHELWDEYEQIVGTPAAVHNNGVLKTAGAAPSLDKQFLDSTLTTVCEEHDFLLEEGVIDQQDEAAEDEFLEEEQFANTDSVTGAYMNLDNAQLYACWSTEEAHSGTKSWHTAKMCSAAVSVADEIKGNSASMFSMPKDYHQIHDTTLAGLHDPKRAISACWLHPPHPHCVLSPFARKRVAWDLMGTLVLAWDLFQVPVVVFDPPTDDGPWRTFRVLATLFWTLDIPASFLVGYFDKYGVLVMDSRKIARQYLRSWFLFDVALVAPDWISFLVEDLSTASSSARILKLIRFSRSFRLLRLFKSNKLKDVILVLQNHLDSPYVDPVFAMCVNAMLIVCVAHLVACFFFWIGTLSTVSWIDSTGLRSQIFGGKYLEAFRLSLLLCLGKPIPVAPQNNGEKCFLIAMTLIGLMVFATFVGGVTSRLTKIRELIEEDKVQMFHLKEYLKDNKVPLHLKQRIVRFVDFARTQHKRCRSSEDVVLLNMLSGPLHVELQTEVYTRFLLINPFLKKYSIVSAPAISQLCYACLKEDTLGRNDSLFRRGARASKMYFVKYGVLSYRLGTGPGVHPEAIIVRRGYWFCEGVLWVPWWHQSRMKALVESDLIGLHGEQFRDASVCHPNALVLCRAYAIEFLHDLQQKDGARWDVPRDLIYPEEYEQAEWHNALRHMHNTNPMGLHFSKMIAKAEEIASHIVHDDSDDDEDDKLELAECIVKEQMHRTQSLLPSVLITSESPSDPAFISESAAK